jgi:hypothetical protein
MPIKMLSSVRSKSLLDRSYSQRCPRQARLHLIKVSHEEMNDEPVIPPRLFILASAEQQVLVEFHPNGFTVSIKVRSFVLPGESYGYWWPSRSLEATYAVPMRKL